MESHVGLCDLPGELQDRTILELHPSAAIGLSQTNHHFRTVASIRRLNEYVVDKYLNERNVAMLDRPDFLCSGCLLAKSPTDFLKKQLTGTKRKDGYDAKLRLCVDCMGSYLTPGNVVYMGAENEKKVVCMACVTMQANFCVECLWCYGCAPKRRVAEPYTNFGKTQKRMGINLLCRCEKDRHDWYDQAAAKKKSENLRRETLNFTQPLITVRYGVAAEEGDDDDYDYVSDKSY